MKHIQLNELMCERERFQEEQQHVPNSHNSIKQLKAHALLDRQQMPLLMNASNIATELLPLKLCDQNFTKLEFWLLVVTHHTVCVFYSFVTGSFVDDVLMCCVHFLPISLRLSFKALRH